jgi:hypothetical protein
MKGRVTAWKTEEEWPQKAQKAQKIRSDFRF